MFLIVAIGCSLAWFLMFRASHTLGGFLHVLPVIAIIAIVVHLVRGARARRPPPRRGSFEWFQRRR